MSISDEQLAAQVRVFTSAETTPDDAIKLFAQARERCPVAYSEKQGGFWLLLSYNDVKSAQANWRTFASSPSVTRPFTVRPSVIPPELDPPEHTWWRELVSRALNSEKAVQIEPLVRADIIVRIEQLMRQGSSDLVTDFAAGLPLLALFHLLGIDMDKRDAIRAKSPEMMASLGGSAESIVVTLMSVAQLGVEEVLARRSEPRHDFLTELATAEKDGELLSVDQLAIVITTLLFAAHGTTISALSSLLCEVLSSPQLKSRLTNDPTLIPAAVEESLRLHPPIFGAFRRAVEPTTIRNVEVADGDSVLLCWAAANRDPKVYDDPDTFSLDRKQSRHTRHLSFGFGIHTCLGAPIARMQIRVALEELLARAPGTELKDPAAAVYEFGGVEAVAMPSLPAVVRA